MANPYGLTREMADAIVKAVQNDAECRVLLPRVNLFQFFAPVGHAGTARNYANAWMESATGIVHAGLPDERARREERRVVSDDQACTGVAAATARALGRIAGKPGYEFLTAAGTVDRMPNNPARDYHTATEVTVASGKSYVFDWHSTLDIGNPLIFASPAAFKAGQNPVKYAHFWGWT